VLDDVLAVVADASAMALDAVIDAAFAGKKTGTGDAVLQGASAPARRRDDHVGTLRFVAQLHKARLALDAGDSTDDALRAFVPPVHFSRRNAVEGALRSWATPRAWPGHGATGRDGAQCAPDAGAQPSAGAARAAVACHVGAPQGTMTMNRLGGRDAHRSNPLLSLFAFKLRFHLPLALLALTFALAGPSALHAQSYPAKNHQACRAVRSGRADRCRGARSRRQVLQNARSGKRW